MGVAGHRQRDGRARKPGRSSSRSSATPAWTTAWLGVVAAIVAIVVVLPAPCWRSATAAALAVGVTTSIIAGFAVPGLVIALSLAFWALNVPGFRSLYQTVPLLIAAYVVHFGAQALRSTEVAVAAVPGRLDESARLLGASAWRRAATVHLPLMRPGCSPAAGWCCSRR